MREQFNYGVSDQAWTYAKTKKLEKKFAMPGIEPLTSESELSLRPKSSGEPAEVRTRDLAHAVDERNHQTKRLTSTIVERTRGFLSSYANIFFLGRDRGVTGRFFAAIGGVQFSLFLRGPLLRRQIRSCSSFSCFYRGIRRSRSGSSSPTNKLPQNHSEPPLKGEGYPPYLMRGEY